MMKTTKRYNYNKILDCLPLRMGAALTKISEKVDICVEEERSSSYTSKYNSDLMWALQASLDGRETRRSSG